MLLIVIGLLMAFYAPILTFFYVQGSSLALAGAMNAMGSVANKGIKGGASKAGGAAAGAFKTVAGKMVQKLRRKT